MSTKIKFAAVALAAVTLASTTFVTTEQAEAKKWGWGPGIGVGIAAGALIGAGIASSAYSRPTYVYDGPSCRWVRQYDAYGYYLGKTRVCGY
jgi:hypothetical protein